MTTQATQCTESYYAIRIGKWPKNPPYFMWGDGTSQTPQLFRSRDDAIRRAENLPDGGSVVRVTLTTSGATE